MTQKKLVQAFKAFIQKSVLPLNTTNQVLLNDWKHFNNIISADPIDTNQLDFYLYVINKQPTNSPTFNKIPPQRQTTGNISDFTKFSKRPNDFNLNTGVTPNNLNNTMNNTNNLGNLNDKTNSQMQEKKSTLTNSQGSRRKNLIANMQNFQNILAKNQQKLENYNKSSSAIKQPAGFNTSITSNGGTKKYY